ncbi:MAG TPA: SDR family oxidoreductase [Mycobacterium sp.]|jgi:NAD(P)-dependent dehydrogenase (short-subunit alcohol dehydrogenase family)
MNAEQLRKLFDLSGRTVVITGGTRGIGFALAQGHLAAGANVVVTGRSQDRCDQAQAALGAPDRVAAVAAHMGDLGQVKHLVEQTVSVFGGIDVVINNAATSLLQQFGEITPEAWHKSLSVNVTGPLFLVQEALPHLEASEHAAVLNLISPAAFMFAGHMPLYAAGKSAIMALTRSMAAAFAPRGIRVNALAPGPVDTQMMRNNPPEFIEATANETLLRRLADPEEMIGPALLLTTDAGSYITGQVLLADAGMVPH